MRQRGYVVDALKEFILDQDVRTEEIDEVREKAAEKIEKARKISTILSRAVSGNKTPEKQ